MLKENNDLSNSRIVEFQLDWQRNVVQKDWSTKRNYWNGIIFFSLMIILMFQFIPNYFLLSKTSIFHYQLNIWIQISVYNLFQYHVNFSDNTYFITHTLMYYNIMCTCVYARKKKHNQRSNNPFQFTENWLQKGLWPQSELAQDNANHKMTLIEAASTLINHDYPQYQLNTIKAA